MGVGKGYYHAVDTYTHNVGDQALSPTLTTVRQSQWFLSPYFPKEKLRPKEVNKSYQSPDLLAVAELGFKLISVSRLLFD